MCARHLVRRNHSQRRSLRRLARQDQMNGRPAPRLAFQLELSAQTIDHNAVNDMQAETGGPLMATRGEEGVECLSPDVRRHAAAVVGKYDLDVAGSRRSHLDSDCALAIAVESMRH